LAYALVLKKKKKKAFIKPFGKRFAKTSLCRNFEKMVLKKKNPPCGGGFFLENCF
jgi:hypothetical protein